jgi:predicted nucleic acid-binding protein
VLLINGSIVLAIDDKVVSKTIDIRKKGIVKLPDAIIAATAFVNDLILITRNTKVFPKSTDCK